VQGTKPITPENPIPRRLSSGPIPYPRQLLGSGYRAVVVLRVTLDSAGSVADVQRMQEAIARGTLDPRGADVQAFVAAATDAVKQWRYQAPADPPIAFFVTVRFDGEGDAVVSQSDGPVAALSGASFSTALPPGDVAEFEKRLQTLRELHDRAAARLTPQHPDVLLLDRQIGEMERELERARNLQGTQGTAPPVAIGSGRTAGPGSVSGQPIRVGGNIRPPAKTKHVDPAYPEVAMSARIQGVVILETTIDEQGRVAEVRVLRSIPLLDQAAVDAVRQWEFTPTLLNGAPVPVILTTTVQFTLSAQ
jgi:protein TonB